MSRRVHAALLAAALAPCLSAGAQAEDPADLVLRDLGLAPAAQVVTVDTARRADGLVAVTLVPSGQVKLVADPGVTVFPVDSAGQPVGDPTSIVDIKKEYFTLPPSLAVQPGPASALRVEYAYCVVTKQCLFGDVTVPVPPPA
jgi:hypothetical protein